MLGLTALLVLMVVLCFWIPVVFQCLWLSSMAFPFVPVLFALPSPRPISCHLLGLYCTDRHGVEGFVKQGWEAVETAFRANFDEELEFGAQMAVYHRGELVVDLVGGTSIPWANRGDTQEVSWIWRLLGSPNPPSWHAMRADELVSISSCSKVLESLVIAMAVDRGLLQYDAPVAQYWAEFGSQGKENITVAQLMRHQAGLVILSSPLPLSLLKPGQEDRLATVLAQSPLNWSPDMEDKWPRQVYHAVTRGMFSSALLRHVDPLGRGIARFFEEEIAQPLGLNISLGGLKYANVEQLSVLGPSSNLAQLAKIVVQLPLRLLPRDWWEGFVPLAERLKEHEVSQYQAWTQQGWERQGLPLWLAGLVWAVKWPLEEALSPVEMLNMPRILASTELVSVTAFANARSMALLGSALAGNGSVDAMQLLSLEGLAAALVLGPPSMEEFLGMNISFTASGWGAGRFPQMGLNGFVGWAGITGAQHHFHPEADVSFALVPNFAYARLHKPSSVRVFKSIHDIIRRNVTLGKLNY